VVTGVRVVVRVVVDDVGILGVAGGLAGVVVALAPTPATTAALAALRCLATLANRATDWVAIRVVTLVGRRLLLAGQRRQQRGVGCLDRERARDRRPGGASGRAASRPSRRG